MPTVLRVKGYRFFFFSSNWSEPPHIHAEWDDRYAKLWLEPVMLARARGFRSHELTQLARLTAEHRTLFLEKWHEHFSG
ncbi:MAG: DUF4160 domain-containing protein [Planctomycetes bacterium]|nr:DUF4160 domain-containing protein [Planctomycetota bacterium]